MALIGFEGVRKTLIPLVVGLFTAATLSGQTGEAMQTEIYRDADFLASDSLAHPVKKARYELGAYFPSGYLWQKRSPEEEVKIYVPMDSTIENTYDGQIASGFLSISKDDGANRIPLDIYDDLDLLKFTNSSDRLLVFKSRYHFFVYDLEKKEVTKRNTPGKQVYEGEDAISPLISALTLFDEDRFLLGNVQAYGIFCYDLSDPTKPKELTQHSTSHRNDGQYYLFLYPKEIGSWDIILANSSVESPALSRVYQRFESIRYALRDADIRINGKNQPDVTVSESGIAQIALKNNSFVKLNLYTGELTRITM